MPVNASPSFGLQPSAYRQAISTNYISSANFNFANQYLPDLYEKEFERFGNRSITGFLRMVGAEMPCASDLIKWAEQGRLHTKWTNCQLTNVGTPAANQATLTIDTANTGGSAGYPVQVNQPMTPYPTQTQSATAAALNQNIRVGQTLICQRENGVGSFHGRVASITYQTSQTAAQANIVLDIYEDTSGASFPTTLSTGRWTVWIYGSEFRKGTTGMAESTQVFDSIFENNPIILKDKFAVTGSDMTQIGWVEVTTENGASGYLWYMKAEHEARLRFDDYLEASMLEAVPVGANNSGASTAGFRGTEGVFAAVTNRGNIFSGGFPTSLVDFDAIVQRLDKQGAIEENALFVNRAASFAIDDFLAAQNSYGTGGTSYGLFNNSEQMALNLGFRGFRRGYDFYKTDWKYLNDPTMRGQGTTTGTVGGTINGLVVPSGTTNVYDEVMGQNAKRPFLHVRYRETDAESRKYKTWATGSAGGAATSDLDALEVHYLSERCICTLGANNFFLFQS